MSKNVGGIILDSEYGGAINPPTTPTKGIALFTRKRARSSLAQVDKFGYDTMLQTSLACNGVLWVKPAKTTGTPIHETQTATQYSTATAGAMAATNVQTRTYRSVHPTTAVAGTMGGFRVSAYVAHLSATAGMGGFHFIARFGIQTAQAGSRGFIGLYNTLANIGNVNPSTLFSLIGVGWDAADTNLSIMRNNTTGAAVKDATGMPLKSKADTIWELAMYAPPGGGQSVEVYFRDLAPGAANGGLLLEQTYTTELPANDDFMGPQLWMSNGTTAAIFNGVSTGLWVGTDT